MRRATRSYQLWHPSPMARKTPVIVERQVGFVITNAPRTVRVVKNAWHPDRIGFEIQTCPDERDEDAGYK